MERFEPCVTVLQKRSALLLQRLLPTHQLGFLGGIIFTFNHTVEKRVEKFLQPEIDRPNLRALLVKQGDQQDDVLLPFEGDRTLSVILSKAFLLAADTKIKDETITRQIQQR